MQREVSAVETPLTAERESFEATPASSSGFEMLPTAERESAEATPASSSGSAAPMPPIPNIVQHDVTDAAAPSPLTTLGSSSGVQQSVEVIVHRIQF
jgi:hypothetical protein